MNCNVISLAPGQWALATKNISKIKKIEGTTAKS
jgi:hypothetical protein